MYVWVLWRLILLWSCAPSFRIHYCQCQCVGYMSYSRMLDLRADESRLVRHVKPPRSGGASKKPCAHSRVRSQAIGALAHFYLSLPERPDHRLVNLQTIVLKIVSGSSLSTETEEVTSLWVRLECRPFSTSLV